MKNGHSLAAETVLSRAAHVNHKKAGTSLRRSRQPKAASPARRRPIPPPPAIPPEVQAKAEVGFTLGELAWNNRAWPRGFDLPGLERLRIYTAENLLAHLTLAFRSFEGELHELVATAARKRPAAAAALAEAVAILEQCASMDGLRTDLDDIPSNGESPALRLVALAKVQALNRRHG